MDLVEREMWIVLIFGIVIVKRILGQLCLEESKTLVNRIDFMISLKEKAALR